MTTYGTSVSERKFPLITRKLVQGAASGLTPDELGEQYGIESQEAYALVQEFLASQDVWTEVEKRKLLIEQLRDMHKTAYANANLENPKVLEAFTKLTAMIERLESKQLSVSDEDIERASKAQAALFVQIIEAAYRKARALLVLEYPNVDVDMIDEAFHAGLKAESLEIEQA